jgi:hypothetical protein
MFAVYKEKNFEVPNQMVIAKSEFHTAVLLRINLFCYLTLFVCVCVCVCVYARVCAGLRVSKEGNACLGKAEAVHSPGVRVPLKMTTLCFIEMCGNTRRSAPDEWNRRFVIGLVKAREQKWC